MICAALYILIISLVKQKKETYLTNIDSFITLYNTKVKTILMYYSVIWKPKNWKILKIQNNTLRLITYKMNQPIDRFDHDY